MQELFQIVETATAGKMPQAVWDEAGFRTADGQAAPVILDIGCGTVKAPGSVGLDMLALTGVDIIGDFTRGLPLRDNSVDGIFTAHTLEHAENLLPVMEEFWRVCKPNAAIYAKGPHAACPYTTWSDPTHRRGLTIETFRYFEEEHLCNFYTNARFKVAWARLYFTLASHWQLQGKARRLITGMMERFANGGRGAQYRCERWWGPIIGIEEIHILLRVVK